MEDEPAVNAGSEGAPAEGRTETPNADGSTAKPVINDWESIDPNKLPPEELKHYKFFQGHFTKATQKFAEEKKDLSTKLQGYETLLNDNLFSPLAHYRATGKLPEGFDKDAFATQLNQILGYTQQAQQTQQTDPNAPYIDDGVKSFIQQQITAAVTPLQKENTYLRTFANNDSMAKANESLSSFKDDLKKEDPQLLELFDGFVKNGTLGKVLSSAPVNLTPKERLKFAFDAIASDRRTNIAVEKSKAKLLEELKQKNAKERPESGGASGGAAQVNEKDLRAILSAEFDKVQPD